MTKGVPDWPVADMRGMNSGAPYKEAPDEAC